MKAMGPRWANAVGLVMLLLSLLDAESAPRGATTSSSAWEAVEATQPAGACRGGKDWSRASKGAGGSDTCRSGRALCLLRLRGSGGKEVKVKKKSEHKSPRRRHSRKEVAVQNLGASGGGGAEDSGINGPSQPLPPPRAAREMSRVGVADAGAFRELYPDAVPPELDGVVEEEEGIEGTVGQRPIPKWMEYFCPGHETYKYYKDGHYTGELYDGETAQRWAKISNIYAPHYVGVPRIFEEDDEDLEGTLDYVVTRDRPKTTIDDLLKRTFWKPIDGEPESMWMDGLIEPEDEEDRKMIEKEKDKLIRDARGQTKNMEIPKQSRWLLPIVTAAVDRLRQDYKNMFKLSDATQPPYLHMSQLVIELLQCRWLLDNKTCDENELYGLLVRKNKELSEWNDLRWRKARVPIDVVDKARKNNFFLGCTDQWMLFERKSSLETMGRRIDGSGYAAKGQIKVTGNTNLVYFEREVEEEDPDSTHSTHATESVAADGFYGPSK